ncbi:phosphotransferase [Pararobbsia silviterrae]|uniref:phosphotransferase n=1 Tax=Pararobbsia silviterrae TaxID=1792498 RepID=UPI001314A0DF|nr:phosphotransferase [Pararobbsia silviterrae]
MRQHIARSEARILHAGIFDYSFVRSIKISADLVREELNSIPAVPFLHDATLKNVLVTHDGELSGIVDVDDLCFGDARYPIALTLTASMVKGLPCIYAHGLLHHGGYSDDRIFRLYVAVYLLDLMSEHGHRFNGNERESTNAARERITSLCRAAINRIADFAR